MLPELITERTRLAPAVEADVERLHDLLIQPLVRKYLCDDQIFSREEVAEKLHDAIASAASGLGMWMIEDRKSGTLLGFTALRAIDGTSEVEIFYALAPEFWQRGFAMEASRTVLDYAFSMVDLPRIFARTDEPNVASVAVMKRLGMTPAADPGGAAFVTYVLSNPSAAHLSSQPEA